MVLSPRVFSPGRAFLEAKTGTGKVHHSVVGLFIEKKASPNEWQIWMESRLDAGEIHRSGESLAHRGRVRALARYGLRS